MTTIDRSDHDALAKGLEALGEHRGWRFTYEYPGCFQYAHPGTPLLVMCTPDWNEPGVIAIQIMTVEGDPADGIAESHPDLAVDVPFPVRTPQALLDGVRPWLDRLQPAARYDLHTVDGEVVPVTLADFFLANALHPDEAREIEALAVGATYRGGGGAAPQWSITRTA